MLSKREDGKFIIKADSALVCDYPLPDKKNIEHWKNSLIKIFMSQNPSLRQECIIAKSLFETDRLEYDADDNTSLLPYITWIAMQDDANALDYIRQGAIPFKQMYGGKSPIFVATAFHSLRLIEYGFSLELFDQRDLVLGMLFAAANDDAVMVHYFLNLARLKNIDLSTCEELKAIDFKLYQTNDQPHSMMDNNVDEYSKYILHHFWRFVIDKKYQCYDDPFYFDSDRPNSMGETNYLSSMANAMLLMIDTLQEPLSLDYIINLHTVAVQDIKIDKEEEMAMSIGIRLLPEVGFGYCPSNTTLAGLLEANRLYSYLANIGSAIGEYASCMNELFHKLDNNKKIFQRVDSALMQNHECQPYLTQKLNRLISFYLEEIQEAIDADSETMKITTIAEFVHCASLLHPFHDGNTRLFVFLIANKLLLQNGFPPAIFEDPNRFDGYSTAELALELINGMRMTQAHTQDYRYQLNDLEAYFSNEIKYNYDCIKDRHSGEKPLKTCALNRATFFKPEATDAIANTTASMMPDSLIHSGR
jgi:hypothetical protein